jgi:hypothetical protein
VTRVRQYVDQARAALVEHVREPDQLTLGRIVPRRGMQLPTARDIIREPCLFCGASRGEPCRESGSGRTMRGFHAKRMRLAVYIPDDMEAA